MRSPVRRCTLSDVNWLVGVGRPGQGRCDGIQGASCVPVPENHGMEGEVREKNLEVGAETGGLG